MGKYTKLEDAYASVIKALQHAALAVNHRLDLKVSRAGCVGFFLWYGGLSGVERGVWVSSFGMGGLSGVERGVWVCYLLWYEGLSDVERGMWVSSFGMRSCQVLNGRCGFLPLVWGAVRC